MNRFSTVLFAGGFTHLSEADEICGRHLRYYVERRRKDGISVRTLHNQMSHLRGVLRGVGRASVADAPELTNARLGLEGGTRIGTKTAMEESTRNALIERANSRGRPGLACIVELEDEFGLRGNEAICAREDVLQRWLRELKKGHKISVYEGTKGGREREVPDHGIEKARATIQRALDVARRQRGFLVVRANGSPAGDLKAAISIYRNWAHRAQVQMHSARYAYAEREIQRNMDNGCSPREACVRTCGPLGHGDGRGRYVSSVYGRRLITHKRGITVSKPERRQPG